MMWNIGILGLSSLSSQLAVRGFTVGKLTQKESCE